MNINHIILSISHTYTHTQVPAANLDDGKTTTLQTDYRRPPEKLLSRGLLSTVKANPLEKVHSKPRYTRETIIAGSPPPDRLRDQLNWWWWWDGGVAGRGGCGGYVAGYGYGGEEGEEGEGEGVGK